MKNLIQRLKNSIRAFLESPVQTVSTEKRVLEEPKFKVVQLSRDQFQQMVSEAQELAKSAHIEQNKLMDDYFNAILAKNVDPFIVELYKSDKKPIPYLNTHIHSDVDPFKGYFSRRMTINIGVKTIGDALFIAEIHDGEVKQKVEEKIPR